MMNKTKIVLLFLLFSIDCFSQSRQNDKVTCSFIDQPLAVILDSLSDQIDYFFSYNSSILEGTGKFTISADNQPFDQFLSKLLAGTGIEYSFFKDQIILNFKEVVVVSKKKNHFTLSGIVKDENGNVLANASVFLDGTTIGTFSDIDGNYKLESIPPGYYDLVFSHVGYGNATYSIIELNGGSRMQNHKMELDLNQLEEVEISSNRITQNQSEWEVNFLVFKKELLGSSDNAKQCVIENPEVINFFRADQKKILRAYATDPIRIRNDALGYRIEYFLESFEKSSNDLRYRGKIKFRNAEPLKNSEKREWNRNRKLSYYGSFNHFRNSLLDDDLKGEGFRVFALDKLDQIGKSKNLTKLDSKDLIVFKGDHYELDFKRYLLIEYVKEKESIDFMTSYEYSSILYKHLITEDGVINKIPGHQTSIIKLLKKSVRLDLSGQIDDKFALTTYGYWSWERLADLVPINYDPKLDKL